MIVLIPSTYTKKFYDSAHLSLGKSMWYEGDTLPQGSTLLADESDYDCVQGIIHAGFTGPVYLFSDETKMAAGILYINKYQPIKNVIDLVTSQQKKWVIVTGMSVLHQDITLKNDAVTIINTNLMTENTFDLYGTLVKKKEPLILQ